MNQLNSIIIEGNVTREPDYKETPSGHKICNIPVAVNRFYKNAEGDGTSEVSYFTVETFGKMAEVCQEKCTKGRGIRVVGRLKQSRWETSEGKTASRVSIIAEHVEFKKLLTADNEKSSATSKAELEAMKKANQAEAEAEESSSEISEEISEEEMVF